MIGTPPCTSWPRWKMERKIIHIYREMILTMAQIFTSLLSKLAIMLDVVYTSSRVSVWYLSKLLRPISAILESAILLKMIIKLPSNSNFAESLCKLKIRRYENETSSQRRKEFKRKVQENHKESFDRPGLIVPLLRHWGPWKRKHHNTNESMSKMKICHRSTNLS